MQPAGKAFPLHFLHVTDEAGDEPDITVESDCGGVALVIKEGDVGEPDVALPRVVERQRDVVHDIGVVLLRERGLGGDGLGPVRRAGLQVFEESAESYRDVVVSALPRRLNPAMQLITRPSSCQRDDSCGCCLTCMLLHVDVWIGFFEKLD